MPLFFNITVIKYITTIKHNSVIYIIIIYAICDTVTINTGFVKNNSIFRNALKFTN